MKDKSDQLGAENVSTIHLVYPTLMELEAHLNGVAGKPLCKAFATDLKKNINKSYFSHFTDSDHINFDPIAITATYLSPVHHQILNQDQIHIAEDHIKSLLESYGEAAAIGSVSDDEGREAEETKAVTIPGLTFL